MRRTDVAAAAALEATFQVVAFCHQLVFALGREQSHLRRVEELGTHLEAFAALDAGIGAPGFHRQLAFAEREHAGSPLGDGHIQRRDGHTHHRSTENDFFRTAARTDLLQQEAQWGSYRHDVVAGTFHRRTGHSDHALDDALPRRQQTPEISQRHHVVHQHANGRGTLSGRYLAPKQRENDGVFRALRIFGLQRFYRNAAVSRQSGLNRCNGIRLVVLDTDDSTRRTAGFHGNADAAQQVLRALHHDAVIAGQKRFTLRTVHHHGVDDGFRRHAELHMRGESGAAQTGDTCALNRGQQFVFVQCIDIERLMHLYFLAVGFIHADGDGIHHLAVGSRHHPDRFHHAGGRCVDGQGNEPVRRGNDLAAQHFLPDLYAANRSLADVLRQRHDQARCERHAAYRQTPCLFVIIRMDAVLEGRGTFQKWQSHSHLN